MIAPPPKKRESHRDNKTCSFGYIMCETVKDFGNEIEMRAYYAYQQRKLIPMLTAFALIFATFSFVLSWPRWAGNPDKNNPDLLCAAASMILFFGAWYESRKTFTQWREYMPKVPRIAGD